MSQRLPQRAGLKAMFQLNSWIPLVGASSKLAVRNTRTSRDSPREASKPMISQPRPKDQQLRSRTPGLSPASGIQPLEPKLLPKLRFCFADFPWSHCSIDQRLFTSESGCGYRYGPPMRDRISGGSSLRIAEAPNGTKSVPLSLCVQTPSSN